MNDAHAITTEPHDESRPTPHHAVPYFLIFVMLIALTIVTVAIATVRFQNELVNVLLALLVASMKALLVAFFFMHLKFEGKLIYVIASVPLLLCVLLVVALIPDILGSGHPASSSMHPFNSFTELFRSAGEPTH